MSQLKKPQLSASSKCLYGPSRQPLQVIGQFTGTLSHKGNSISHSVYVVKQLKTNLLGLPAISSLKLVARVDETTQEDTRENWLKDQFPTVFRGLGTLGEPYEIERNAKLFSLSHPSEIQGTGRITTSAGIISKVDQPTPWCAGMVVVQDRVNHDLCEPLNTCSQRSTPTPECIS